jgi:hypothetical protein
MNLKKSWKKNRRKNRMKVKEFIQRCIKKRRNEMTGLISIGLIVRSAIWVYQAMQESGTQQSLSLAFAVVGFGMAILIAIWDK